MRPNPICPNFAPALVALAILCGASCGTDPRQSVPGPTDPVDQAVTRLRECLPPSTTSDVSLPQLAVSSIVRLPNQTRVELVAVAAGFSARTTGSTLSIRTAEPIPSTMSSSGCPEPHRV